MNKKILILSFCLAVLHGSAQAQVYTLKPGDEPLVVSADEYFRVLYVSEPNGVLIHVTFGDIEVTFGEASPKSEHPSGLTLRGPLSIRVDALATIEVLRADPRGSVAQPSNSVVIPSNENGDVEIILESSEDLISWTAALPGTYESSTQRRFFRVRAVVNAQ